MASSYSRGWPIVFTDPGPWLYVDTGLEVTDKRPCSRCGKPPTKEGFDACLGEIPGVSHACCGHGVSKPTLVRKDDSKHNEERITDAQG